MKENFSIHFVNGEKLQIENDHISSITDSSLSTDKKFIQINKASGNPYWININNILYIEMSNPDKDKS